MKSLPLLLCALLAAQSALAADPGVVRRIDESRRVRQAYAEVIASCAPIERRVAIAPHFEDQKPRELLISRPEWSGGCAGDLAHGEGTMTVLAKTSDGSPQAALSARWQGSGLVARGKKAGPWLILAEELGTIAKDQPVTQSWSVGLYQWEDAVYPGYYQRQANGDMVAVTYGYQPGEKISPGSRPAVYALSDVPLVGAATVALHKQQRMAGVSAGPGATVPVPVLADLLPGGAVAFAPEGPLRGARGKSAMLVLSKGTAAAFRNLDDMSQQLQAFAEREHDPELRKRLLEMAAVPNSTVLVRDLAVVLRRYFKTVGVAPDLHAFQASQADYAIVLDLRFEHDIGKFFKAYERAQGNGEADLEVDSQRPMRGGLSALVLNRQLQVQASAAALGLLPSFGMMVDRTWIKSALDSNVKIWRMILGSPANPGDALLTNALNDTLVMGAD